MGCECEVCLKVFTTVSNMRKHIKNIHKINISGKSLQYKFKCECGKNFNKKKHLRFHKKKIHGVLEDNNETNPHSGIKCPLCECHATLKSKLLEHFKDTHDINIEYEELQWSNFENFESWKSCMEKDTNYRYVKKKTFFAKNHKTLNYICHRSGYYVPEGTGKRRLKTQGSNKINSFCPSRLTVVISSSGKVNGNFLKTHVGHQAHIGHLSLTSNERPSIAEKIASKIQFSVILDDIRDSVGPTLEREHLLTPKDLFNIENTFNLNSGSVHHSQDAISVESWATDMKNSGSVLFYKGHNQINDNYSFLKAEDFVLVIMTDAQGEIMSKYGLDCVCVDGTHGMNGYGFELNTVLVLDSLRQGFPCAFLISNRSDQEIFRLFFSCIKEKVGTIICKVFMSDLAEAFYNAWSTVMSVAQHRLYCTWYLDRAWRNNLHKITSKEKQVTVYKQLCTLQQETEVSTFRMMLKQFLQELANDSDTQSFLEYFSKLYAPKVEQWAYCYRMHTGLNTYMHIERVHKTLKYIYLHEKNEMRLDKAIAAIMKFVRDKLFDELIILHKGKICHKIKEIRVRHKGSLSLDPSLIIRTEYGWNMASSSSFDTHKIEEYKTTCTCQLSCNDCGVCIHRYRCSCIDSEIKWNMCKHIHLLCKHISSNMTKNEPVSQAESDDENRLCINICHPDSDATQAFILNELARSTQNGKEASIITMREEIKSKFFKLLDSATSLEQLNVLDKALDPINSTFAAMTQHSTFQLPTLPKNSIPNNKKIQQQRRLYRTKQTNRAPKRKITKPTKEEIDVISLKLIRQNK